MRKPSSPFSPQTFIGALLISIVGTLVGTIAGVTILNMIGQNKFFASNSILVLLALFLPVLIVAFIVAVLPTSRAFFDKVGRFAQSIFRWTKDNWQLVVGLVLFLITLWGIYLTNSYWIMLNAVGFTIAVIMLYRSFVLLRRNRVVAIGLKFLPIPIPPGIGNEYFGKFYIDSPSGDVLLGGVEFQLQSKSLVFDTGGHIREHYPRDDGSKEIKLSLREPIKSIKSVHILINSGNSKDFYISEKVGEIKLIFRDAPPITKDLILGKNLREWCVGAPGNLVREHSDPLSKVVWQGVNRDGTYAVIDSLEIPVPDAFKNNALEQIVFVHKPLQKQEDTFGVQYFVSAIALEIDRTNIRIR